MPAGQAIDDEAGKLYPRVYLGLEVVPDAFTRARSLAEVVQPPMEHKGWLTRSVAEPIDEDGTLEGAAVLALEPSRERPGKGGSEETHQREDVEAAAGSTDGPLKPGGEATPEAQTDDGREP
jgi:hypothetical protein